MPHQNSTLATLLQHLDLGSSVAESDRLLEVARVETSAFTDLLDDRVDLIPGTKGSGKSALFRIFVDFLPDILLKRRKVVIAHGVQSPGDPVFHAFTEQFSSLDEQEFVSFWCIYLVSLAHEQFVKSERYATFLEDADREIEAFRRACAAACIPEIRARKSLRDVLQWTLHVLSTWSPKVTYKLPDHGGAVELDLFGGPLLPPQSSADSGGNALPKYVNDVKDCLDMVLAKVDLSLWLMIDRLDEVFPRRSDLERTALRGMLKAMRFFSSERIRVKIFLRDDMLDQVIRGGEGFTALTHITARQADALRWNEEQILSMIVNRFFADDLMRRYLGVDKERLKASAEYRSDSFYKIFPSTVHRGPKQSPTLRWICHRCCDGNRVVTPRDVIDLLDRAKQRQHDDCAGNPDGMTACVIGPSALQYGLQELSTKKRQTYLKAEFPHLWEHIEKFVGGKTEYNDTSLQKLLGRNWSNIVDDLVSIGLLEKTNRKGRPVYLIPSLYRHGLQLTQGKA